MATSPASLETGADALAQEARNPDGVAVIIGNREYAHRDVPEVTFAHRDADAFRRYVIDVLGYDPENVIDLRDASRGELFDAFGTQTDPRSHLWSYLNPDGGSDVVVFYSGHGVPGVNDGRGYLLSSDANPKAAEHDGYPIDLLYKNLGSLPEAETVRVYLDACFSGSSAGGAVINDASPVYLTPKLPEGVGEKVVSLTAASGKQIASWDKEKEHGLFTHHLLDALYGGGDADGDRQVTASEAKAYLDKHMTRAARRQHRRVQEASLLGSEGVVLAAARVDGVFPARSDAGIPDQVADPLEGTATVTPKQQPEAALEPSPLARTPEAEEASLGLNRDELRRIQRSLMSLGLYVGPADGLFGKDTRGALKEWQSSQKMSATGYLDADSAKALLAVQPETSITVRTVPSNAKVRVFTASGSTYRDAMNVQPGRYEIAVDAPHHEPFRQWLAVEGPTTYKISLCKLETKTEKICENEPVTRTRNVTKYHDRRIERRGTELLPVEMYLNWVMYSKYGDKAVFESDMQSYCLMAEESAKKIIAELCETLGGKVDHGSFRAVRKDCGSKIRREAV